MQQGQPMDEDEAVIIIIYRKFLISYICGCGVSGPRPQKPDVSAVPQYSSGQWEDSGGPSLWSAATVIFPATCLGKLTEQHIFMVYSFQ